MRPVLMTGVFTLLALVAGIQLPASSSCQRSELFSEISFLSQDHGFFEKNGGDYFWKMIPFYQSQMTDASCGLATTAMVLNMIRSLQHPHLKQPLISEEDLLTRLKSPRWRGAMAAGGTGVILSHMKQLLMAGARVYGVSLKSVDEIHVENIESEGTSDLLQEDLKAVSKQSGTVLVANFLLGLLTGEPDEMIGHMAPLPSYDTATNRVFLLDPYRVLHEPYWVSSDKLLAAMATFDADSGLNRGYLRIRF